MMHLVKRVILTRMTLFPIHNTGHAECFLFKSILVTYYWEGFEDCYPLALLIQYKQLLLPFIDCFQACTVDKFRQVSFTGTGLRLQVTVKKHSVKLMM